MATVLTDFAWRTATVPTHLAWRTAIVPTHLVWRTAQTFWQLKPRALRALCHEGDAAGAAVRCQNIAEVLLRLTSRGLQDPEHMELLLGRTVLPEGLERAMEQQFAHAREVGALEVPTATGAADSALDSASDGGGPIHFAHMAPALPSHTPKTHVDVTELASVAEAVLGLVHLTCGGMDAAVQTFVRDWRRYFPSSTAMVWTKGLPLVHRVALHAMGIGGGSVSLSQALDAGWQLATVHTYNRVELTTIFKHMQTALSMYADGFVERRPRRTGAASAARS